MDGFDFFMFFGILNTWFYVFAIAYCIYYKL